MYLLDTNVVSELSRIRAGNANTGLARWVDSVDAASLFLSAISIQKLEIGVLLAERKDAPKGALLRSWLEHHVLPAFDQRILPVVTAIANRSAKLHIPDPKPSRDTLIASTALVHGLTMVTRDVADFAATGVAILNPWD